MINDKHLAYFGGSVINRGFDVLMLGASGLCAYFAGDIAINGDWNTPAPFISVPIMTVFSCLPARFGLIDAKARINGYFGSKKDGVEGTRQIKMDKDKFPLDHVDKVVIDDISGLESLLTRTKLNRDSCEWGTVLKAYEKDGVAIVDQILEPTEAEKQKYVYDLKENSLRFDTDKIKEAGFNGVHHSHNQFGGAANYPIHNGDRYLPANWINLLTFNTQEGPEVIAYNRLHTYIPKNKDDKTHLVKASVKDIMKYLD